MGTMRLSIFLELEKKKEKKIKTDDVAPLLQSKSAVLFSVVVEATTIVLNQQPYWHVEMENLTNKTNNTGESAISVEFFSMYICYIHIHYCELCNSYERGRVLWLLFMYILACIYKINEEITDGKENKSYNYDRVK